MMMRRFETRTATEGTYVLVGLDQLPFRQAMREDLYNSILTAAVVGTLGLAGIVSVYWAQSYRRSNRLLQDAQALALELQSEVRRNERLSALGTLAAGVAHEIRNPLSTIKGLATYMAKKMPEGEREQNAARTMIQEINRLNNVVSELLGFARTSPAETAAADVGDAAARAIRLAGAEIRDKGIAVRFERDGSLPLARIKGERLTQAFLNLFLNAVQAMPRGGTLEVETLGRKGGDFLTVVVRDDGEGMTEEVRRTAFDPYFTTKPSGTGLGLSIVHQIIAGNGGEIHVESSPGAGSSFTIRLPVAREE